MPKFLTTIFGTITSLAEESVKLMLKEFLESIRMPLWVEYIQSIETKVNVFHLHMLLHNVKTPTCFNYLKTVDGGLHLTFRSVCAALGLLKNDNHWKDILDEIPVLIFA